MQACTAATDFVAPPEWVQHSRTWMSWIPDGYVRADAEHTVPAWGAVARSIAGCEPVDVLCPPDLLDEARLACGPAVRLHPCSLDDAWFRDSGPTFVVDGRGRLGARHWAFNGWGGRLADVARDLAAGRLAGQLASAVPLPSPLVNEGGAIAVDGQGTVVVTESVLLNANRNPGWDRAAVEAELRRTIGATTVVWLARGLHGDDGPVGTDGHVDTMVAFVAPGVVVVHHQPDPTHPDHEVMAENTMRLAAARDSRGRRFEVVPLTAPPPGRPGHADHESYVNFAWANGAVVLCGFGHAAADEAVRTTFARLLPRRRILQVDATAIFRHGGGIHCITQPEPGRGVRWREATMDPGAHR
ncbi:MAG: agmatine/peptidylarginine deiminase [Acidimicrobiia bacterium]